MIQHKKMHRRPTKTHRVTRSFRSDVVRSLTSVASYQNTGKRLAHHHTSHGALLAIVIIAGILIFANIGLLQAYGLDSSSDVSITATVPGPPPTTGAELTLPVGGARVHNKRITIRGSCHGATVVAIFNNGVMVGSTVANPATNTFELEIDLNEGQNTLQAQNYDNLGQLGPATLPIDIFLALPEIATTQQNVMNQESVNAVGYYTPGIQLPSSILRSCDNDPTADTTKRDSLGITVSCIKNTVYTGKSFALPLFISGGTGPYQLSIDWGDNTNDIKSDLDANLYNFNHIYTYGGFQIVKLTATDSTGTTFFIQTVININGAPSEPSTFLGSILNSSKNTWVDASVPLYFALLTLTVGFWIGDLFHRFFKPKKPVRRSRA